MVMVMIMMIMIVVIVMIMIMKIRILVLPPNYERNLDVDDVCQLPFLPLSAFQPLSGDLVQALSLFIEKFQ